MWLSLYGNSAQNAHQCKETSEKETCLQDVKTVENYMWIRKLLTLNFLHRCSVKRWNEKKNWKKLQNIHETFLIYFERENFEFSSCSSDYSLWADVASYLTAHTKRESSEQWMVNKPWERRHICHTSHRINEGIYFYWVIFFSILQGKVEKKGCHGYCRRLSLFFPLSILPSSLRLYFPLGSEQTIAVISTHIVWQVGLFKITQWAEVIVLMWCSRGAIRSLNAVGTVQPLCALHLLQSNQDWIVFEVLAVLVGVEGLTPAGNQEYIIFPSISAVCTQTDFVSCLLRQNFT